MKKIALIIFVCIISLSAETLFEIKDNSGQPVFSISDDGMRVINNGDTMMVISSTEAKINLDNSKDRGLSRSFSVTTSASKANGTNVLEVTTDQTIMRESTQGDQYTNFRPDNIFIGLNSGAFSTGTQNVFLGNESGINNSSGNYNIMIGDKAGFNNSTGGENLFIGNNSGYTNTIGTYNFFIGHDSGKNNTAGNNMFVGHNAGFTNSSGDANLFLGTDAGAYNSDGSSNVFIGQQTGLYNTHGDNNTFVGRWSGNSNQLYSNDNTMIGYKAGSSQTSGNQNTYIGSSSGMSKTSGYYNTFVGFGSGQNNGTGGYNAFYGYHAGYNNTGNYNTFIGMQSGYSNAGSNSVFLGYKSGYNETASNRLYIENSDSAAPLIYGEFDNDLVQINGELTTTGNLFMNGAYFKILTNPGTDAVPTNYVYQGSSTASTSKQYAFTVNDALWVTSHAYIDGYIQVGGGTNISKTQAGTYSAGVNSTGGVKTVTITFPTAFTTTPKVNVTPKGQNFTDTFAVTTRNITTTSFQVNIYRVDSPGGIWGQTLSLDWFAWQQ
ncbi:MAG: hypothetical protein JXR69_10525 [Candidatus Delongbacteria bacterium]|nr:hypothetical protein [Candidatus Delongbacteria bacterium]